MKIIEENSHDKDGAIYMGPSDTRTEYSGTCENQMRFSGLKQLFFIVTGSFSKRVPPAGGGRHH